MTWFTGENELRDLKLTQFGFDKYSDESKFLVWSRCFATVPWRDNYAD